MRDQARLSAQKETQFVTTIKDLRSLLGRREGEINVLKTEGAAAQRRISELSDDLANLRNALLSEKNLCAETSTELSATQRELRNTEDRLKTKTDDCLALEHSLSAKVSEVEAREKRIVALSQFVAEQEGKIAGLRAECAAGERRIGQLRAEVEELKSTLDERLQEIGAKNTSILALTADAMTACAQSAELAAVIKSLRDAKQCVEQELSSCKANLDRTQAELQSTARLGQSYLETIEQSKRELAGLESHLEGHDTLVQEYNAVNENLRRQRSEMETLRENIRHLKGDSEATEARLLQKSRRLEESIETVARLTVERQALERDLAVARASHATADNELERLKREFAGAEASLEDERKTATAENERLIGMLAEQKRLGSEAVAKSNLERDRLREELVTTQAELEVKRGVLSRLESDLQRAEEQLLMRDQAVEQLRRDIVERDLCIATAGRAGAAPDAKQQSETLVEMGSKLDAKEKAIANLHSWCCFLNRKLHAAERELADRKCELALSSKAFSSLSSKGVRGRVDTAECSGQARTETSEHVGETSRTSSEAGYLLSEMRRCEAAVAAAKEDADAWRKKCDEMQSFVDSALDEKQAAESLRARLELLEKDSKQQADFLSTELDSARAYRDAAERECATISGELASLRHELSESRAAVRSSSSVASLRNLTDGHNPSLCRVMFILDGSSAIAPEAKISIVGSDSMLGGWSLDRRIELRRTAGDTGDSGRRCQVFLSPKVVFEYKFVAELADGTVAWESGGNRSLNLEGAGGTVQVYCQWRGAA
jgi:chromosome segregation ATPase